MKRVTAMLMAAVMLLMLTACGAPSGGDGDVNVVGKWQGEIDMAGIVNAFMAENDVLAASGATLDGAPITVTYMFLEDGTASCEVDTAALNDKLMTVFKEILTPMMSMLGGTSVEEYIANSGQSTEELIRSLFTDAVYDGIADTVRFTGTYEVENDKLTVKLDGGNTAMEKVVVSGDTLTLTAPFVWDASSDAVQAAVKTQFPLTLKKVG